MGDLDTEPVYVFELDHAYVFKHYFDREDAFRAIADHYDHDEYRFDVPGHEWEDVRSTLLTHGYEPHVVDDVADFVVVKEAYTPHAEILKHAVATWSRRGHDFFLMKGPHWVERAVQEQGATPAAETDLAVGL